MESRIESDQKVINNSMESRIESDQKVIKIQSIKLFDKLQSLIIQWNPE